MNKLTCAISLPTRPIHKDEEIVDAHGDLLMVRSDDSVDTRAICAALNAYPEMIEIIRGVANPSFGQDLTKQSKKLLSLLGEK